MKTYEFISECYWSEDGIDLVDYDNAPITGIVMHKGGIWHFENGKIHRINGPAVEFVNPSDKERNLYYFQGAQIHAKNDIEFKNKIKEIIFK